MQKVQITSVRWFISRVTRMHWESPGRHTFGCLCEGVSRKELEVRRLALNVGSTTPESWGPGLNRNEKVSWAPACIPLLWTQYGQLPPVSAAGRTAVKSSKAPFLKLLLSSVSLQQ